MDNSGSDSDGWEKGGIGTAGSPSSSPSGSPGRSPSRSPGRSPWGSPWDSPEREDGAVLSAPFTPNLRVEGQKSDTPPPGVPSDAVDLPKCPKWFKPIWAEMNNGFIDLHNDMFKEGTYTYHADMTAWLNDNKGTIESWWHPEVNNDEILILLTKLLVLYHEQGVLDPSVSGSEEAKKQKDNLAEKKVHLETLQADILAAMQDAGGGGASEASGGNKYVALRF